MSSNGVENYVETTDFNGAVALAADAGHAVLCTYVAVGGVLRPDCYVGFVGICPHERLGQAENQSLLASTLVFGVIAYAGGWQLPNLVWCVVLAFWLIVMPWWLKAKWKLNGGWQAYTVGWLLVMPFWFALVYLRPQPEDALSLLAIMGLVWVADIGAYFCGKSFGKRKIAPTISPGKSWEGAIGGALCVAVYMTIVWKAGWLAFEAGWFKTILIGLILTVVSVCGDLLESWLKRAAGIKDSSNLLPGHGGVFDRVDSLIAVISIYAAFVYLF